MLGKIQIVDTGVANICSLGAAFERLGYEWTLTRDAQTIEQAEWVEAIKRPVPTLVPTLDPADAMLEPPPPNLQPITPIIPTETPTPCNPPETL